MKALAIFVLVLSVCACASVSPTAGGADATYCPPVYNGCYAD